MTTGQIWCGGLVLAGQSLISLHPLLPLSPVEGGVCARCNIIIYPFSIKTARALFHETLHLCQDTQVHMHALMYTNASTDEVGSLWLAIFLKISVGKHSVIMTGEISTPESPVSTCTFRRER